jgi:S1-C subfamily serine protease
MALLGIVSLANPIAEATAEKTAQQIFEEQGRAIVVVLNHGPGTTLRGFGSGFLVRPNGVFVTNFHVVERAAAVSIKLTDGRQFPVTGILSLDPDTDIAILKVAAKNLPVVTLGDSDSVKVGQQVLAIGSPMGLENTVSDGLISAIRREEGEKIFQISAPISSGSSGGALLDMKGEVIGVPFAVLTEGQNLNFAIPISYVKRLLTSVAIRPFAPETLVYKEGSCPIIGNARSGIYHIPGGQYYDQMRFSPDRACFRSEEEAHRAGFRRATR